MNRYFFIGQIIEISDYKFFYNSKMHNAQITLKINTISNKYKGETVILIGYDEIADIIYQSYKHNDLIAVEGMLNRNMEIEILFIEKVPKNMI